MLLQPSNCCHGTSCCMVQAVSHKTPRPHSATAATCALAPATHPSRHQPQLITPPPSFQLRINPQRPLCSAVLIIRHRCFCFTVPQRPIIPQRLRVLYAVSLGAVLPTGGIPCCCVVTAVSAVAAAAAAATVAVGIIAAIAVAALFLPVGGYQAAGADSAVGAQAVTKPLQASCNALAQLLEPRCLAAARVLAAAVDTVTVSLSVTVVCKTAAEAAAVCDGTRAGCVSAAL